MPTTTPAIQTIPLDKIVPSPYQTRKNFDPEKLQELAATLKEHGLMNAINVRPVGDTYELIAGERRVRAAKLLGWSTIDARVESVPDTEAAERVVVENLQREDLNPLEQAEGYKKLEDLGLTQVEIASKAGVSQPVVAKYLALLDLPKEILEIIPRGIISERHARAIRLIKDQEAMIQMAREADREEWSAKETERKVEAILEESGKKKKAVSSQRSAGPAPAWDPMAPVWSMAYEKLTDKAPKWDVSYGQSEGGLAWRFWVSAPGPEPRERVALWFKMMAEVVSGFPQDDLAAHAKFKPVKVVEPRFPTTPAEVEELTKLQERGPEAVYEWMYGKGSAVAKDLAGKKWKDLSFYTPELKSKK